MNTNYTLFIVLSLFITCNTFSQQWWVESNSGFSAQLNCATTSRNQMQMVAYSCGVQGSVLKTTNWGDSWQNISGSIPSNINLVTIACYYAPFVGENNNVVLTAGNIGTNTYVYRSSNGGSSWNLVFTQNGGSINSIFLGLDSAHGGFMMGDPVGGRWSLWKSTNAGLNWDSTGIGLAQSGTEHSFSNDMWLEWDYYSRYLWFGTNNNRIYFSSNSGSSWNTRQISEVNIYSIWSAGGGAFVYAAGSNLMKSTNQGLNWNPVTLPGTGNINAIGGHNSSSVIFAYSRGTNILYYTTNWGTNWSTYTALSGNYTYISSLLVAGEGAWPQFAVRSNGGITVHLEIAGAVRKIGNNTPDIFTLFQNYPNPFNPKTIIKFDIPAVGTVPRTVHLTVYDILGKEVSVLVNEQLKPGTYEVEWEGSNSPSGVYFYKLIAGDYSKTKKMIMLR